MAVQLSTIRAPNPSPLPRTKYWRREREVASMIANLPSSFYRIKTLRLQRSHLGSIY